MDKHKIAGWIEKLGFPVVACALMGLFLAKVGGDLVESHKLFLFNVQTSVGKMADLQEQQAAALSRIQELEEQSGQKLAETFQLVKANSELTQELARMRIHDDGPRVQRPAPP